MQTMTMMAEHRLSARTAAEKIRHELLAGDIDFAMRILTTAIADFRAAEPSNRADFLTEPPTTGSLKWDTLLAAVTARECGQLQIPAPTWTARAPLQREWIVTTLPHASQAWKDRIKARTPPEFSRLGLWIDPANLETL